MKKILTFLFAVLSMTAFAQVQVTFQVDMTGQSVSADGVHIAGSLNGWTTDSDMLTDQGNNIYAVTLDLKPGTDYEFKYLNGNAWGTEEAAPATCTVGGSNRIFTAPTSNMTLPVVPFNSCPTTVATQAVKFSVDMTGQPVSADGVHVAGNFNAWTPDATALTDVGNNIYEATVIVLSSISVVQYKFINGNAWGGEEVPGAGCGNGDNNRPYIIEGAGATVDLPVAAFGGCANPVPTRTVIFKMNLGSATPSTDGIHVAGSFNGWATDVSMMTDLGNGTYEFTTDIITPTMYVDYKYLNGNAWGTEEAVPAACAYADNRYKIIELASTADTITLPEYEFGTCNDLSVSTKNIEQPALFQIAPTFARESVLITWETTINEPAQLVVYSLNGSVIHQETINNLVATDNVRLNVSDWTSGMYIIQLRAGSQQYSQKIVVE